MATVLRTDCCPCVNDNDSSNVCKCKLSITYDWSGYYDLDTGTTFLGTTVGWSCGSGGNYIQWTTGDNTSIDGPEIVEVDVGKAHSDEQWSSSVEINLAAGWYRPDGDDRPTGGASIKVKYGGVTKTKNISPGTQHVCASSGVGTVTVYDDGTFDLN